MAYVADNGAGALTPIRVATNTALPAIIGVGTASHELAITPDGRTAYVADNGSSNVYPLALASGVVGAPISVGSGLTPLGIAITPDWGPRRTRPISGTTLADLGLNRGD